MAYEEDVTPADALDDLADLEALREQSAALPAGRKDQCAAAEPASPTQQKPERVHLKGGQAGRSCPISDLLPMLENFGLRVISERPRMSSRGRRAARRGSRISSSSTGPATHRNPAG